MQFTTYLHQHARTLVGASLLLALGATANAADTYNLNTHQVTIGSVTVGNDTLTNVVANVTSIVTPPSGSSANGAVDSYNPSNQQLTVQTVTLSNNSTYYNAVVTLATSPASIGGATGSDSYASGQLTIPSIQVGETIYTDVVVNVGISDIISIGGGLPTATADSYSGGVLTVPVVTVGGRVYTNVMANVSLSDVVSIGGHQSATTGVLSTGFNSDGTTTTSTSATGTWSVYAGGSGNPMNGSGGGYADKGANPSYEYEYVQDTLANLGTYTYEGVGIKAAAGQTVSASGFNALSFSLAVNPEWLQAGANFVVLITTNVSGVSSSTCNPEVAAVVTATASAATAYTVPLTAFNAVRQNCTDTSITPAQILAGNIVGVDFQADGGTAAIPASGLTSTTNLTVPLAGSSPVVYPTTVNVVGGVSFVTASTTPPTTTTVLSTGFNSNGTTTTSTSSTGTWSVYAGGSGNPMNGSGGGYADKGVSPSYEYEYVQDTLANLGTYTFQGVGIQAAADQTVSTSGTNNVSFSLAVNPEWLQAGANFVVLITTNVSGVSNSTCNPEVAAVVTATASAATAYTVPLTAFTKVTQNCGDGTITPAQILAGNVVGVDFQADGGGAAIPASGLTSTTNLTVPLAGSSPVVYPTTVNVVGGVSFTN